jgi:SOS-response transcriptional repressor LexA
MARAAKPEPSEKMLEVIQYIISFVEENGFQPSQAEMAAHFGVTKSAIAGRLRGLHDRGVIRLPDGDKERAIVLPYVRYRSYLASEPQAADDKKEGEPKRGEE